VDVGLDLVEYAMAIEEAFQVRIPDREAARLRTLGDVHDWVCANFGLGANDPHAAWATIVRLACAQFFVEPEALSRDTRLLDLAPDG
jgi:hypothetical protein